MNGERWAVGIATTFVICGIVIGGAKAQSGGAPQTTNGPKKAEEQFKNIQTLKGIPADQLIPSMQFISASLGVECEFCHVQGDNSNDDRDQKKTARMMISMEMAINKDSFNARTEVTCYTCHRGATQPVNVPLVVESTMIGMAGRTSTAAPAAAEAAPAAPVLPTADVILAKYVQALGGEQVLRKITSRVITGTRDTAGRNTQTTILPIRATFEDYEKTPNLMAMIVHTPDGQTTATGFDGNSAWSQSANGVVTEASGTALARAKRAADFYESLDLKQEYTRMTVRGIEKVSDRDAYVVICIPDGDTPERLYFDTQTGLLVRKVSTSQNVVVVSPTQTDYLNYRDAGGAKYPSTIKIVDLGAGAPPNMPATYTVLHVEKVDYNAPLDGSKLTKPVSKGAAERPQ